MGMVAMPEAASADQVPQREGGATGSSFSSTASTGWPSVASSSQRESGSGLSSQGASRGRRSSSSVSASSVWMDLPDSGGGDRIAEPVPSRHPQAPPAEPVARRVEREPVPQPQPQPAPVPTPADQGQEQEQEQAQAQAQREAQRESQREAQREAEREAQRDAQRETQRRAKLEAQRIAQQAARAPRRAPPVAAPALTAKPAPQPQHLPNPLARNAPDAAAQPLSIRDEVLGMAAAPALGARQPPSESESQKLERIRTLLQETLRFDSPVFGARTLLRLREAASRDDLIEIVWAIERHLADTRYPRKEMLSLHRARELLGLGNTVVPDE